MLGERDGGKISQAYREHRPYLVDLAFRMLGDIGAAEDVVQEAFARLMRAGSSEIADPAQPSFLSAQLAAPA